MWYINLHASCGFTAQVQDENLLSHARDLVSLEVLHHCCRSRTFAGTWRMIGDFVVLEDIFKQADYLLVWCEDEALVVIRELFDYLSDGFEFRTESLSGTTLPSRAKSIYLDQVHALHRNSAQRINTESIIHALEAILARFVTAMRDQAKVLQVSRSSALRRAAREEWILYAG